MSRGAHQARRARRARRAIPLDLGGVLIDVGFTQFAEALNDKLQLNLHGEQWRHICLFEDRADNIDGARRAGLRTFQVNGPADVAGVLAIDLSASRDGQGNDYGNHSDGGAGDGLLIAKRSLAGCYDRRLNQTLQRDEHHG